MPHCPCPSGHLMGAPSLGLTRFLLEQMAASPTQLTRSPRLSGVDGGQGLAHVCAQRATHRGG